MKQSMYFKPAERPDVLVEVDGEWYPGELRMWMQHDDGAWSGQVQWRRESGMTFLDEFPRERIRQDFNAR